MAHLYKASTWIQQLQDQGIVPPMVRRVIIDIQYSDVAMVYYECVADSKMFSIDLMNTLKGAKAISIEDAEVQK